MEQVVFSESWSPYFAEFNVATFDDFFLRLATNANGGNKKRNVASFTLGEDPQKKTFFIKRFFRPYFKDVLFAWRNIGQSCSQGRYEYENARFLIDNGIGSYRPVCFGEQKKMGVETKSFIVTEKLQSTCLSDYVREKWKNLEQPQKNKIVAGLGVFVRRIHELNISLPDLFVYHIYINENTLGEYDFAVIDLHRMSRNVTSTNSKLKNLGKLNHSMLDKYFDDKLKRLLVKSYAGNNFDINVNDLVDIVEKRSKIISAKRKQKPY